MILADDDCARADTTFSLVRALDVLIDERLADVWVPPPNPDSRPTAGGTGEID